MNRSARITSAIAAPTHNHPDVLAATPYVYLIPACRKAPEQPTDPPPTEHPEAPGTTLQTTGDAQEIFRRAFWREPSTADQILHAERREWISETDGVRRWQWFLCVKPGPELAEWLRTENPFLTLPIDPSTYQPPATSPDWFAAASTQTAEIHRNSDSGLTLLFDPKNNLLHATDAGHGFRVVTSRP
jgi:hypothetical protein